MNMPVYFTIRQMFQLLGVSDPQLTQLLTNKDKISAAIVQQLAEPVDIAQLDKIKITAEDLIPIKDYLIRYIDTADRFEVKIDDLLLLHCGAVRIVTQDDEWGLREKTPNSHLKIIDANFFTANMLSYRTSYLTLRLHQVRFMQQQYAQIKEYCRITGCSINTETYLWEFLNLVYALNKNSAPCVRPLAVGYDYFEARLLHFEPDGNIVRAILGKAVVLLEYVRLAGKIALLTHFGQEQLEDAAYEVGFTTDDLRQKLAISKIYNPCKWLLLLLFSALRFVEYFVWGVIILATVISLVVNPLALTFKLFCLAYLIMNSLLTSQQIMRLVSLINQILTPLAHKLAEKIAWSHQNSLTLIISSIAIVAAWLLGCYMFLPAHILFISLMVLRVGLELVNVVDKVLSKQENPTFDLVVLGMNLLCYFIVIPYIIPESIRLGVNVIFWLITILHPLFNLITKPDECRLENGPKILVSINDRQLKLLQRTAASTNYFAHFLFNQPLNGTFDTNKAIVTGLLQENAAKNNQVIDEDVLDQVLKI